ncbi:MAG: hypothetical protein ACSHXK_14215 [Oceanococcus sp.]
MSDSFDSHAALNRGNQSPVAAGDSTSAQILKLVLVLAFGAAFFFTFKLIDGSGSESPALQWWAQLGDKFASAFPLEDTPVPEKAAQQVKFESQRQIEIAGRRADDSLAKPPAATETNTPASTNPLQRLAEAVPLVAKKPFKPALNLTSDATDVQLGPQAQVVVSSKYAVVAYAAGNPNDRQTLLTPALYKTAFDGEKYQAIRSVLALPDGRYLFGGWHGLLLARQGEKFVQLSNREQEPTGSIRSLVFWQGAAYAAGRGLWRIKSDAIKPEPIAAFADYRLQAVLAADDGLFVANSSRVWKWRFGQKHVVVSDLPATLRITGLFWAPDQQLRILTNGGLFIRDENGRTRLEALEGVWLREAKQINGQLWLASWKQGLLMRENGQWHRYSEADGLAGNAVSALAIDAQDHMWLALYGKGGWQAPRADVLDRIRQLKWDPHPDPE